MDNHPTIIEALESPKLFGPVLGPLTTWHAWTVCLKTLYGLPFSDQDREVFKTCTGRTEPAAGGYSEGYFLCGRRGGKSKIVSLIAAYESIFGGWDERLSPGERGWIFIIATDKKQAGICLGYIRSVLALFPDLVASQSMEEIHLKNNISLAVKTASFRVSRGFSTAAVICDELSFWRDENSANPAEEVLNSILPGLLPDAKLIGISTPYGKMGYLWQMHKDYFGKDSSDILVWQASTKMMNPTFSDATIKRLIARDPSVFRAEFSAEFREDLESFLPLELITATMTRQQAFPDPKNKYVCFIDPSGGRQDAFTLGIAHTEGDKILLDRIEERKSPFDPAEVTVEFSTIMKGFGIRTAIADRFGGIWVEDSFKKNGIKIEMSDISASEIYLELLPLMTSGKVELIKNDRLLSQLQNLERRTQSGGKDKVTHPAGLHDDVANSAAGAVVAASRNRSWSLEEMEKGGMPTKGEHKIIREGDAVSRDAETEMREFLGGSRKLK